MKRLLWTVLALALLAPSLHAQTQVISRGRASTANATATPLTSGSTFTGTWEDARDYPLVSVSVFADQNSASSGWKFQWSSDATNVDLQDTYTVTASTGQSQTSVAKSRYFRAVYVNGGTNQGVFRLATIFQQGGGPSVGTVTVAGAVTVTGTVTTAPPSNASTNVAQLVGTAVDVNSGTKSAGTQRIVIATDQPALTNALKVDGSAVTQPVSGTVTATQGTGTNLHAVIDSGSTTAATQATAANLNAQVQGAGASGAAKAGNPVQQGGVFNTTQPTVTNGQGVEAQMTARGAQIVAPGVDGFAVTGTVTTTPPSNASTNLAQVVGTTADVNSGNKSAGTLRVVLATDQPALTNKLLVTPDSVALPANQSVNAAQLAGTTTDTNSGNKSAGTLRVVLATDQPALTNKLLVTPDSVALPANQSVNLNQIGGSAIATAATGSQKVGITGNAGAAVDAANNAAVPANVLAVGLEAQTGQPTAATTGNMRRPTGTLDGQIAVHLGGVVPWTCSLDNIAATLTQCKAAPGAGLRDYITDIVIASTTATAGQFLVRTGTGSNCGTGTASLFPSSATVVRFPYPGNTSTVGSTTIHLITPLQPPAAAAICILCIATQTCTVQMQGYEAP